MFGWLQGILSGGSAARANVGSAACQVLYNSFSIAVMVTFVMVTFSIRCCLPCLFDVDSGRTGEEEERQADIITMLLHAKAYIEAGASSYMHL